MNIFETLKKLSREQRKHSDLETSKTKDPSYIYLEDNQIKEIPLSKLDSAGALINRTMNYKSAKLIRDSIFGK